MKKGLSLVELMISLVLMGVIVLGAAAFDSASRRLLASSETKTEVLNKLTFVLDHINKNVSIAIGDNVVSANRAISVLDLIVRIRQDINGTPENYGDDRYVTYTFNTGTDSITFWDGSITTTLVSNSLMPTVVDENNITRDLSITESDNGLKIEYLTLRYRANETMDRQTNPEVSIDSQFFYPLSQSSG